MRRRITRKTSDSGAVTQQQLEEVKRLLRDEMRQLHMRATAGVSSSPDGDGNVQLSYEANMKAQGVELTSIDVGNPTDNKNRVRWLRASDRAVIADVFSYADEDAEALIESQLWAKARATEGGGSVAYFSAGEEPTAETRAAWLEALWAPNASDPIGYLKAHVYDTDLDDGTIHEKIILGDAGNSDFVMWASLNDWTLRYFAITHDFGNLGAGSGTSVTWSAASGHFPAGTVATGDLVWFLGASPRLTNSILFNLDTLINATDEVSASIFNCHPSNAQDMAAKNFHFLAFNTP